MNYGKYNTICCKHCFYLLICNELSCIDQGNQLLIMNIITILQPSNFIVFLHVFLQLWIKNTLYLLYNVVLGLTKIFNYIFIYYLQVILTVIYG